MANAESDSIHDDPIDESRRLLNNVAYRLLGSVADAEDAVQEAYVRWYRLPNAHRRQVISPPAWLVRVVSRICLDTLRSAPRRREDYRGEWLPEPVPGDARWSSQHATGAAVDPAERVTLDETVSMALLVVLESMTPAERVTFVLHDVFRHSFREIGDIVGRSPEACRQLATSARRRIESGHVTPGAARADAPIVTAFKAAWETGDLDRLISVLDPSVVAIIDGGGLVSAALDPICGAEPVARFLLAVLERQPDLTIHETSVNGTPGLVARAAEHTMAVVSLGIAADRVDRIWAVRNPAKLNAWR